jgi:hypothetical protein
MASASIQALSTAEQSVGSADWSRWSQNRFCFYDYIQYPGATNEWSFFTVPYGSLDPATSTVKTLEDTNMNESRSFGRVSFVVRQIRTHIRVVPKKRQATGISDQTTTVVNLYTPLMNVLANLQRMGTLVMSIGQKEYFDINQPFITCPPGFNPRILQHAEATGGVTQSMWFQQSGCPSDIYHVTPEQMIEAGQTFVTKIIFDKDLPPALTTLVNSTTPKVQIGILLDGYVLRPIQ